VQRVVVVGRAGAGKTYVANELSRRTGLPVVHLDRIFWRAGWHEAPRDEALAELRAAVTGDRWIVDGNFLGSAGPVVSPLVDTVVFIDAPRLVCIRRVLARRVRDAGKERPDLPAPEAVDWPLVRWIWRWDDEERGKLLALVDRHEQADLVVASSSDEAIARLFADG
jgi:adenylate kinase family enzyme